MVSVARRSLASVIRFYHFNDNFDNTSLNPVYLYLDWGHLNQSGSLEVRSGRVNCDVDLFTINQLTMDD